MGSNARADVCLERPLESVGGSGRRPLELLPLWRESLACLWVLARAVVVASSGQAYGALDELPYREDHPLQP